MTILREPEWHSRLLPASSLVNKWEPRTCIRHSDPSLGCWSSYTVSIMILSYLIKILHHGLKWRSVVDGNLSGGNQGGGGELPKKNKKLVGFLNLCFPRSSFSVSCEDKTYPGNSPNKDAELFTLSSWSAGWLGNQRHDQGGVGCCLAEEIDSPPTLGYPWSRAGEINFLKHLFTLSTIMGI